jgi:hypothetical protein
MRQLTLKRLDSDANVDSLLLKTMESTYFQAETICVRHKHASEKKFAQKLNGSERRIRELIFEIIGEYGKSEARIARRQDYLAHAVRLKFVWRVLHVRLQRYVLCLRKEISPNKLDESDSNDLIVSALSQLKDSSEINFITNRIISLSKNKDIVINSLTISSIIKLTKQIKKENPLLLPINSTLHDSKCSNIQEKDVRHDEMSIINSTSEYMKTINDLRIWKNGKILIDNKQNAVNTNLNLNLNKLLSISSVVWIHPSSYYPDLWRLICMNYDNNEVALNNDLNPDSHDRSDIDLEESYIDDFVDDDNNNTNQSNNFKEQYKDKEILRNVDRNNLNDLVSRLLIQHSSSLASDRVYVSLDERFLCTGGIKIYL